MVEVRRAATESKRDGRSVTLVKRCVLSVVLILEPDLRLAKFCRIALHQDGHETTFVADGNSALLQIERIQPDVVVVDLEVLPDGPLFWRRFRDLDKRPPLLVIAPLNARGLQEQLGAEASLTKPFDPNELSRMVESSPDSGELSGAAVRQAKSASRHDATLS